jgi:glutathione-regulated potassium-efflux system ancillary protein KefC
LNHQIITEAQYSHLVATVIASAVIPTAIANAWFLPKHLLPKSERAVRTMTTMAEDAGE